jgi:molybdate transport system regulatory protein
METTHDGENNWRERERRSISQQRFKCYRLRWNAQQTIEAMPKLSVRIDLDGGERIGPGKIALLKAIGETGSISAAGRQLHMSYRRAWKLIEELNAGFKRPLVTAQTGGKSGGGAALTALGKSVVAHYTAIETKTHKAATRHLAALQATVRRAR